MAGVPIPLIRRKAIIKRFLVHGAISPETAKAPEEVGSFKGLGRIYSHLESRGVLKSCGGNRYYVDTAEVAHDSRRIRSNFLMIFGAFIAIALAITSASTAVSLYVMIPGLVIAIILIAFGVALGRRR